MTNDTGNGHVETEKLKRILFKMGGRILMISIIALSGFALQQQKTNADIDPQKNVYLFLHASMDLEGKSINALVANGFSKEKIIVATPHNVGKVGDYMAMLWLPPTPDHIKIQQITGVVDVKPEGLIGYWKGVSKEELYTIPLELD